MSIPRLISVICILGLLGIAGANVDLHEVQKAIQEQNAKWQAESNWLTDLSDTDLENLFHNKIDEFMTSSTHFLSIRKQSNLPAHFDWRDNEGNWLTPVKNQGTLGACQIFAGLAMIESWWKITQNIQDEDIDLSEQYILSCADTQMSDDDGFNIELAFEYIKEFGIPMESCMPYQETDSVPCEEKCDDWELQAITIPEWGWVTNFQNDVDIIKSALFKQPLLAGFTVYQDFVSYKSGVYERTIDTLVGGHAVLIIGWDDDLECWICKNSWGSDWGEDGYFRIKWGECNMGTLVSLIHDEQADTASLSFNPERFDVDLVYGESVQQSVMITNSGSKDIQSYAISFASGIEHMFQVSDFLAYDSLSLWIGNSGPNRYLRNFISFLDLPTLDLSSSDNPKLSFLSQWSFCRSILRETNSYCDGFQVWISKDGGATFEVLQPSLGEYNCRSLLPIEYFFGWTNIPFHLNVNTLEGWSDIQGAWTPFEFDLSPYRSSEVILRVCVISYGDDGSFIVQVVKEQLGAFLDEISVTDGTNIYYENHGENCNGMTRMAVFFEKTNDWITLEENPITIKSGANTTFRLTIDSKFLEPGKFQGYFGFNTNEPKDSANIYGVNEYIPVNLNVKAPRRDVVINKVLSELEHPAFFLTNKFGTTITNIGELEINDILVGCSIQTPHTAHSDTLYIASLQPKEKMNAYFSPLTINEIGDYQISVSLIDHDQDTNGFNNLSSASWGIDNTINNFDCDSILWTCSGGFGITNKMNAHTAPNGAHVSNGQVPYPDNMDATLTLNKPLHLGLLDHATLKYYVRGMSETDKDFLFTEISIDSTTWIPVDSLSGVLASWIQREVDLTTFIDPESPQVWLRYHFISDDQTGQLGYVIDDVELYEGFPTIVKDQKSQVPQDYYLSHNYPNPFNPQTTFTFRIPQDAFVTIRIYDILGNYIKEIMAEEKKAGCYNMTWDGRDNHGEAVPTGLYIYHMRANSFSASKKMTIIK